MKFDERNKMLILAVVLNLGFFEWRKIYRLSVQSTVPGGNFNLCFFSGGEFSVNKKCPPPEAQRVISENICLTG